MTTHSRHPLDAVIGRRIRAARASRFISTADLAGQLGVSPYQVRKYEDGSTRVSATRLFEIARLLDVPLSTFYKQEPSAPAGSSPDAIILTGVPEPIRAAILALIRDVTPPPPRR